MASETELRWHPDIDKYANIGNSHYFALVNHTPWPITVISGTTGDHISGLEFSKMVDPDECYIHDIMSSINGWKFSAGGTFCIKPTSLDRNTDVQYIDFAMSNARF